MSCGSYRKVKLQEHGMKIVERVQERQIQTLINLNKKHFGFRLGKGTVDAIFNVRRILKEYQTKEKKLYVRFAGIEKAFYRAPRKIIE